MIRAGAPQTSEPGASGRAHAASPQTHEGGRHHVTPLCAPSLELPRRELDAMTATQSREEPPAPARSRPAARRDHSTMAPGGEHMARARDCEESSLRGSEGISQGTVAQRRSRSQEPVMTHLREDRAQSPRRTTPEHSVTAPVRLSHSRTSRRSSPAAQRAEFLETPGGRYPRGPDLPQETTQFSHPIASMRAHSKLVTDTPREWSSVGERATIMPAGPKEQEPSPIVAMDLRTPADRPACMEPTPAHPLHRSPEDKVTFKTPGLPQA